MTHLLVGVQEKSCNTMGPRQVFCRTFADRTLQKSGCLTTCANVQLFAPRPLRVGCWPEIALPRGEPQGSAQWQQHDSSKRRQHLGLGDSRCRQHSRSSFLEAVRETRVGGLWSQGTCLSVPLHLLAVVVSVDPDPFMETQGEPE